jgi:hypothetical protein
VATRTCSWPSDQDDPTRGPLGFIVTREIFTPGGKEFLVWLGYHNGDDEARTADYMAQIADMARQAIASASQSKARVPTTARSPA